MSPRGLGFGGLLQPFHRINARRVAPVAFVVHAVAEHIAVFALQADVVGDDVGASFAVVLFIHQHSDVDFGRAFFVGVVNNGAEGGAFVVNVVNNEDGAVFQGLLWISTPLQVGAAGFVAVTGGVEVADFEWEAEFGHQFAGEHQAAVHHAENDGVFLGQILRNADRHVIDGLLDLCFCKQAISFIPDLLDIRRDGGHCCLCGQVLNGGRTLAAP